MTGESKFYSFVNFLAWLIPGASFIAAVYASITNSQFRPQLASDGTKILIGMWVVTGLAFKFFEMRPAGNAKITFPGKKIHAFYTGAILALWVPWFFLPLQAQKVEIILDVSQRMGAEFSPPGTTKFNAAREGVFQVLNYLENQNVEVALRLVNSSEIEQCKIEPESSLAVDFTKDLDRIRNYVDTIQISPSNKAPIVKAIDFSISHYQENRIVDQEFYIYSFLGGNDTCGDNISVYLDLPHVRKMSVFTDIYMIVMLGTDEEEVLRHLPNAKLAYARTAGQVQQIVQENNRLINIASPTPTIPGTFTDASGEFQFSTTLSNDLTTREIPVTGHTDVPAPAPKTQAVATKAPTRTSEATVTPSFTVTFTKTRTPTLLVSPTKTQTIVPSHTPPPEDTSTPTAFPTETPICPASTRIPLNGVAYSGSITINDPANCSTGHPVETEIEMKGSYSGIPEEAVIWVLVYPPNELYYPQSPNACATPTAPPPNRDSIAETWDVKLYLGVQSNPLPEWFDIIVVLADQEASNFLSNWLHTACQVTPPTPPAFLGIDPETLSQMNIIEKSVIRIRTR